LWWVDPMVGLAAMTGFAVIIVSVVGFDRAMLRLANEENEAERRYSATLVDTLGNTGTVYALRQAKGVTARLERRLLAVFVPLRRAIVLNEIKWCTVDLATRVLNCCLVALFVWLAARHSSSNTLLLGSLYMVWAYAEAASSVIASIASHFQTFARQHADYASANAIWDADGRGRRLAEPALAPEKATIGWNRLTIRDLTFNHAVARGVGLEKLTFTLERGKRYALIGPSGSGKSTLLRVLAGLYNAERIALTADGAPTCVSPALAAETLRANATLIPQDAEVYEGTLGENLGLCESVNGLPAASEYAGALESACATDFVQATPIGLEATVAERGANWSGGQRSRVALARGILAATNSALVLMDEPTANLDPATEARVYTNLFNTFAAAAVISSIHRLSLLDRFDEVLVMENGRLVAQCTTDEWLARAALINAETPRKAG